MIDTVPDFQAFFRPLLEVIRDGHVYSVQDLYEKLADYFELSERAKKEQLPSQRQATYRNRIAWAKTYLKKAGLVEQPERAMVKITPEGLAQLEKAPQRLDVKYLKDISEEFVEFHSSGSPSSETVSKTTEVGVDSEDTPEIRLSAAYKSIRKALASELLERIKSNSFQFFEQLVVDLLIAMGYGGAKAENGTVTQATQDGGIDGVINEDKLGLDIIYVQAKRWDKGTVGRPEIQKFVGALAQHGAKKGVFITTATFSPNARDYTPRNDTRIILIDGEELAQLMIEHNVGVSIKETYHIKRVDTDYFEGDVI